VPGCRAAKTIAITTPVACCSPCPRPPWQAGGDRTRPPNYKVPRNHGVATAHMTISSAIARIFASASYGRRITSHLPTLTTLVTRTRLTLPTFPVTSQHPVVGGKSCRWVPCGHHWSHRSRSGVALQASDATSKIRLRTAIISRLLGGIKFGRRKIYAVSWRKSTACASPGISQSRIDIRYGQAYARIGSR
jgi:hypothetical protein